jgi:hypothetical protein
VVGLPELDRTLQAKMDTGAYTASLSAKDIEVFQRDGEDWVRFRLATKDGKTRSYEHKLARMSKIKKRADSRNADEEDDSQASLSAPGDPPAGVPGRRQRTIEVNLTDRSNFNYPS